MLLQTGTGKSHTMTGQAGEQAGIIPRSFAHIFEAVEGSSDTQWMVRASFLEIYNEEVCVQGAVCGKPLSQPDMQHAWF